MMSHQIDVDWRVGEEVYDERFGTEALGLSGPRMDLRRARALIANEITDEMQVAQHALRGVLLFMLSLLLSTGHAPMVDRAEAIRIRDGMERSLALEAQAWQLDYAPLAEGLIDAGVDDEWQRAWHTPWSVESGQRRDLAQYLTAVQPLDEHAHTDTIAQATVRIDDSLNQWWLSSPYRETRFFRQEGDVWQRTLPAEPFWGDSHTRQGEHLRFDYRTVDTAAVEAIAPQMEEVYETVHQTLGLELSPSILTIVIVPDLPQATKFSAKYREITSPVLSQIPIALSNTEYLAHQVASQITAVALEQAVVGHPNLHLSRWQRMTWVLRGWLRTDALTQRAPWHQQADALFQQRLANEWPLRLRDLGDWDDAEPATQAERMWQYAASESFFIYTAETYGREIIPVLLDGFGQYPTWKELVPAVFHTSADQLERGYNGWLAARYALSPALSAE